MLVHVRSTEAAEFLKGCQDIKNYFEAPLRKSSFKTFEQQLHVDALDVGEGSRQMFTV